MDWYAVKILCKNIITGEATRVDKYFDDNHIYFEESLRMVKAKDFDEAEEKAKKLAKERESSYVNIYGQEVSYKFVAVTGSFIMTDMCDGEEVFSEIFKVSKNISDDELCERFEAVTDDKEMRVLRDCEF